MEFKHIPVLRDETITSLSIKKDGIYVDGTAGGGGHSQIILSELDENGVLICIDQDPDAIKTLQEKFSGKTNCKIVKSNFSNIDEVVKTLGYEKVDGVLLDIGVSSRQLDTVERGFSFHTDAPLDMRMSQEGLSAYDLVNNLEYRELASIINSYGEEKFASSIAKNIVKQREIKAIETTLELAEIIRNSVPQSVRREGHPARKTFQAIRIAVNKEFEVLEKGLEKAFELLNENGRLSVITFHSLEDRIVKKKMASWCVGCTCPKQFPICVCGNKPKGNLVNKKPVVATKEELEQNVRSRSAKLRTIKKL